MDNLIQEVYSLMHHIFSQQQLPIRQFNLSNEDRELVRKYAEEPSNFDGDSYRSDTFRAGPIAGFKIGQHTMYIIGQPQAPLPMKLYARALQAMADGKSYTIFLFLNPSKRVFPPKGTKVGPTNINGGYCMICQPDTIVVYREEDSLRVLIHELQHAGCCDNPRRPIEHVEAETEAWAELIYAMLLACSAGLKPEAAWRIQSSWATGQNRRLTGTYNVRVPADYAWRYTVGKEDVWRRWGLPLGNPAAPRGSLRLGAPEEKFYRAAGKN